MYLLINKGCDNVELASKKKKLIVEHLKKHGYYYSRKLGFYINDKSLGCKGCDRDYRIIKVDELK